MRVWVAAIFFFPFLAFGQGVIATTSSTPNSLPYFFTLYCQSNGQLAPDGEPFRQHVKKLESKRSAFKTQKAFVHHLFTKTHQKFLTAFKEQSTFSEMMTGGIYNCLTATALYSLILNHFDLSYKIVETNFHIFIIVNTKEGSVLLETTDQLNGFIDNPLLIKKKVDEYTKQVASNTVVSARQHQYSFSLQDTVSVTGVLGLLHFNHATKAYNNEDYKSAITHLHHAYLLHASPRMDEFAQILLLTIKHHKKLSYEMKENFTNRIQSLQNKRYSQG